MRWFSYGFAGLIALIVGGFSAISSIEQAQTEMFYAKRPMLRAMDNAMPTSTRPNPNPQRSYAEILFERVPHGTARERTLDVLTAEGIRCTPVNGPDRDRNMVCYAPNRPMHVPRWHVELAFNQNDELSGARVLSLKATAE